MLIQLHTVKQQGSVIRHKMKKYQGYNTNLKSTVLKGTI